MGIAAFLRDLFTRAKDYTENLKGLKASGKKNLKPQNPMMDALSKVLNGELAARMHAESALEILTALKIGQEFSLKLDIIHALDAYKVTDEISSKKISVIYGPIHPAYSYESFRSPALLDEAGVMVCLTTDSPVFPQKHLRLQAIFAAKFGMKKDSALRAITINPAKIVGFSDRIGSLEKGKDADIVILSGDPLDIMSQVETVLINGKICFQLNERIGGKS
jgi:imidazolonepropionase-like amidohydrolase